MARAAPDTPDGSGAVLCGLLAGDELAGVMWQDKRHGTVGAYVPAVVGVFARRAAWDSAASRAKPNAGPVLRGTIRPGAAHG